MATTLNMVIRTLPRILELNRSAVSLFLLLLLKAFQHHAPSSFVATYRVTLFSFYWIHAVHTPLSVLRWPPPCLAFSPALRWFGLR
jgi:hypothetical protein